MKKLTTKLKPVFTCPYFNPQTQVKWHVAIDSNLIIVQQINGPLWLLARWGFWGSINATTLRKGKFSNREIHLSAEQIQRIQIFRS